MKVIVQRLIYFCTLLLSICFISIPKVYSQEIESDTTALRKYAVKVFLDMPYQDYIKTEITFVNYVRDRNQAQVHIMSTTQRTGSGGKEYTIMLFGQQDYANMSDTLKFTSKPMDTEDVIREGIIRTLKIGLMRYVAKTPLADNISTHYEEELEPTEVVDRWNYWVFNCRLSTSLNGETSMDSCSFYGSLSADRVTPDLKINLSIGANYYKSNFRIEDDILTSILRSQNFNGLVVKSLGEHFSLGMYGSAYSSTYTNTKFSIFAAPAIEYNIFPYSESTRREFSILYKVGNENVHYNEETIYNKTYENLIKESLSLSYEIKEKWRSVSTTLEGSHYFHDFSKNNLRLYSNLSLNLFEGFSLDLFGSVSMIHDQLSLPKESATQEEILLRRRELET